MGGPALHFALIGALLFMVVRVADTAPVEDERPRIVIPAQRVALARRAFPATFGRPPTRDEQQRIVDASFTVPAAESRLAVLRSYGVLGVEHILYGFDHLLFVLALVLLVRDLRRLLWTITAFTAGHSVTLALAVLGFVHVPQAPVEAGIAFSIYVLAIEIVRRNAGRVTLMQRLPWLVAGAFGLLHGLGFAGALAALGLPQGEIPLALFAFNLGIEAGQIAFVAVVLSIFAALRLARVAWPGPMMQLPAYAIGSLAAFWFFERVGWALSGTS